MKENRFRTYLLSTVFLGIIFFPLLNESLVIVKDSENTENRAPAEKPKLDISYLDGFPKKYDKFYNDNFSIRQLAIKSYNDLNLLFFKKSPIPEVIIGNDNWLYLGGTENDNYTGKNPLTPQELEEFKLELEYRKSYLNQKKIEFYVMIAPVKATIYPEYIPMNSFRKHKLSWGEQLNQYLKSNSNVDILDLYSTLRNNKDKGQLYKKLDNHWNDRAAFYTVNYVLSEISQRFKGIDTLDIKDFWYEKILVNEGNISKMLSNTTLFSDSSIKLKPKNGFQSVTGRETGYPVVPGFPYTYAYEDVRIKKDSSQPRLLIISDSFGDIIFPFLAESFSKTTKIFDAWQYKLNEEIVENEKPDVVILVMLECNMRSLLKHQSRLKEAIASK